MSGTWHKATSVLFALWLGGVVVTVSVSLATAGAPLDPEAYDLNMSKGLLELGNGRYDEAERMFRAALQAKPGDIEANFYLGQTLVRTKRYVDAEFIFRLLLGPNPENGRLLLGLGIALYNQKRYDEALTALASAEKSLPNDPLVPYYQGLSYHQKGAYDRSPPRFLKASALSPDLAQSSHYFSGVAYYQRGVLDEAIEEFEAAIASGEPESELTRSAREFLQQAKGAVPKGARRWDLSFTVISQYDNNVVLLPLGTSPPSTEGISRKDDYRTALFGRGEYRPIQTESWTAGASYSFYQSFHRTLSAFDVEYHTPIVFVDRRFGPLQTRAQYALDYVKVGRSPFLVVHAAQSLSTLSVKGRAFTQLQLRYQDKDFQHGRFLTNSLRDGKNWLASLTQYLMFAENTAQVWVGYTFDTDVTGGGSPSVAVAGVQTHADWAYTGHRISTGLSLPPERKFKLDLSFDYYRQSYKNPSSFSASGTTRRSDDTLSFTSTLSRPLIQWLSGAVQYSYTRNQANLPDFDYQRSIVSLMLTAEF